MASETTSQDTAPTKVFTKEEVAQHTTATDLWVIINRKVYDLTGFLKKHPGGEEVLVDCAGRDATESFEDIGHSSDARQMMKEYEVGDLEPGQGNLGQENATGSKDVDNSSGSWTSWLTPIAFGILATLVYRYFIKTHYIIHK